ncbi:unnamed protein product [Schistosoma mattheei]|uniref:Elapor1/2 mannose 6-phosphate receptor homology domain-containing protein n=2 Tax=Schistosoma TaxID=6181 RepID=A0A183P3Z9_9TREM|nr:unnamed protein product [Schistosoma mattheei]
MQLDDLDFADNLALLSHMQHQMQEKTNSVATASATVGLSMHKGKSRILRYNTACTDPITVDGEALEDVKTFTYLGSIIDEHDGSDADVKAQIDKARAAYLQLKNIWNSKQLSTNTKDQHTVNASICRHTRFEASNQRRTKTYSKPTRLADRLIRMVPSNVTLDFWQEVNKNLTKAGWMEDKFGTDLHYIFASDEALLSFNVLNMDEFNFTNSQVFDSKASLTTETNQNEIDIHSSNCPHGRTTVITLRCVFTQNFETFMYQVKDFSEYITGKIELPPLCPDGTCDGCTYHFLWTSMYACRMCQENDYEKILSECSYGRRQVHLRAPWECRVPQNRNLTLIESCPLLSKSQTAAVLLTVIILIILGLIIFMCHRRNKKLEYKYMKLVQSTSGKNQVTSCAIEGDGDMDKGGSVYYTTMNNNNNSNNNNDNYNKTRIKSPPSYADSTGIVLEPNEFLKNDHFTQMGFKGLPKVNLPPIIYKVRLFLGYIYIRF